MIKLKTDARTPTLTPEQFALMRDALYVFLGGDALAYMGRIAVNDLVPAETDIDWADILNKPSTYPPEAHEHPEYEGGGAEFPVGALIMFGGSTAPFLCRIF